MNVHHADSAALFSGPPAWREVLPVAGVAAAALASAALVWWPTQSAAISGGFAAAGLLGAALLWAARSTFSPSVQHADTHDWALVRAIAQSDDASIAITDRTGRLVCANDHFIDWFGGPVTPPNLPVDAPVVALLTQAGREAWRDGEAAVAAFPFQGREVTATITRIGRQGDHLFWRWSSPQEPDRATELSALLRSGPGNRLAEAGVMVALVSAGGNIVAANPAFALRAAGSVDARVDGLDFARLLRMDGRGALRFERDRDGTPPLRLIELPVEEGKQDGQLLYLMLDDDAAMAEPVGSADQVTGMIASLPFAMALVDRDGRLMVANAAFRSAANISADAPLSFPGDLVIAEDKGALAEAIRRHSGGRGTSGGIGVRLRERPDTATHIGIMSLRGMGNASVVLSIADETGDDGQMQQRIAQATKMQAVGQLAGGIAHDFNNILTAILGGCDLMLLRHAPGDSDYDDIQQVRSNANRAANLTRQLLAFSRQQTLRPQILNLSDIVSDVSHLLQRLIGEKVKLAVQHGRGLGAVRADPVQLEQVIVNLAVNARDAMEQGGTLTIATRAISSDELRAVAPDIVAAGDYSLLEVIDTGSGMPPHVLAKIFDPFFTTKDVGKGTGLGLATVYGIVKQSGGYIFANSTVGKGTRFSIYLPVYQGSEQIESPKAGALRADGAKSVHWGSGTILLVEDEEMVRAVAERALSRAGYTVVTAIDGEDGLDHFSELADVDLIISDVMMPQLDGPTMVTAIRRKRADVPVLFMSGYAEEQLRQSIALTNVGFLPKPFSVAQLVDAVAAIRQGAG